MGWGARAGRGRGVHPQAEGVWSPTRGRREERGAVRATRANRRGEKGEEQKKRIRVWRSPSSPSVPSSLPRGGGGGGRVPRAQRRRRRRPKTKRLCAVSGPTGGSGRGGGVCVKKSARRSRPKPPPPSASPARCKGLGLWPGWRCRARWVPSAPFPSCFSRRRWRRERRMEPSRGVPVGGVSWQRENGVAGAGGGEEGWRTILERGSHNGLVIIATSPRRPFVTWKMVLLRSAKRRRWMGGGGHSFDSRRSAILHPPRVVAETMWRRGATALAVVSPRRAPRTGGSLEPAGPIGFPWCRVVGVASHAIGQVRSSPGGDPALVPPPPPDAVG